MAILYQDRFLTFDEDGVTIRWYYFPLGDKRIHYSEMRGVVEFDMRRGSALTSGRWRIWGSGNFTDWFHLDPGRTRKDTLFAIDKGDAVRAVISPDDPAAVRALLETRGLGPKPAE